MGELTDSDRELREMLADREEVATADFLVASPLFHGDYERTVEDYSGEREAFVDQQEVYGSGA